MLGKLIKHEFKAVNRLMIPLHLALILITIVGRFYIQFSMGPGRDALNTNIWYGIISVMLTSFYVIALVAICIITWVYLHILRPRKNLFTDEGYLMHTLPVSAASHIFSKLIVAFVWTLVDALLLILSVAAMFVNAEFFRAFGELWREMLLSFPEAFGVSAGLGIPVFLLVILLDVIRGFLIIFMCIAVGHSFNSHKILSSVGVYVGFQVIGGLLSSIFMALTGLTNFSGYGNGLSLFITARGSINSTAYFWSYMGFSLVFTLVLSVVSFLVTNYFLTRRLNLE